MQPVSTIATFSHFLIQVSNLSLSLVFAQHRHYQLIFVVSTTNLASSCQRTVCLWGETEKSIKDWLSLLLPNPIRFSHVKSFSLPCSCLLGLQVTDGQWVRRHCPRNSQWLIKGIFIWKTNGPTLKGNESQSDQPLWPALNYLLNLVITSMPEIVLCVRLGSTQSYGKSLIATIFLFISFIWITVAGISCSLLALWTRNTKAWVNFCLYCTLFEARYCCFV